MSRNFDVDADMRDRSADGDYDWPTEPDGPGLGDDRYNRKPGAETAIVLARKILDADEESRTATRPEVRLARLVIAEAETPPQPTSPYASDEWLDHLLLRLRDADQMFRVVLASEGSLWGEAADALTGVLAERDECRAARPPGGPR